MKKYLAAAAITVMAATVVPGVADARPHHPHKYFKLKGGGSGGMSPATAYVFGATFCSAGALWVHGLYVSRTQRRELTRREAFGTVANCFLPVVGGLISDSMFRNNPSWNRTP